MFLLQRFFIALAGIDAIRLQQVMVPACGSRQCAPSEPLTHRLRGLLQRNVLAVNLRGRVDFVTSSGAFPMNQALVELCFTPTNACMGYTTGYDGMYYFGTSPGPYYVRINGKVRQNFDISDVQTFDLPPLQGN